MAFWCTYFVVSLVDFPPHFGLMHHEIFFYFQRSSKVDLHVDLSINVRFVLKEKVLHVRLVCGHTLLKGILVLLGASHYFQFFSGFDLKRMRGEDFFFS
jgi:hypothetical protein